MSLYTLSDTLLRDISDHPKYITEILHRFTTDANPHKIVVDKTNVILQIYSEYCTNPHIYSWFDLLTKTTGIIKKDICIPTGISREEIYLYVCSSLSSDRRIIVSSKEDIQCIPYKTNDIVVYNNSDINVLDRDDAVLELQYNNKNVINNINNSILAGDNNEIDNIKIKSKNG